jgi:hypothetical protein
MFKKNSKPTNVARAEPEKGRNNEREREKRKTGWYYCFLFVVVRVCTFCKARINWERRTLSHRHVGIHPLWPAPDGGIHPPSEEDESIGFACAFVWRTHILPRAAPAA